MFSIFIWILFFHCKNRRAFYMEIKISKKIFFCTIKSSSFNSRIDESNYHLNQKHWSFHPSFLIHNKENQSLLYMKTPKVKDFYKCSNIIIINLFNYVESTIGNDHSINLHIGIWIFINFHRIFHRSLIFQDYLNDRL